MADEETTIEEVVEEVVEEKLITAEIPYGVGMPSVVMPFMGPFDEIAESITYRAQLVAREQKLNSGVSAAMPIGVLIGFAFALVMVLLPVLYMT